MKKKVVTQSVVNHLINSILNRKLFKYGARNIAHYFVACVCFRTKANLRGNNTLTKHYRLILGESKLSRELDVIKILKSVRDVQLIKNATMRSMDKILMKF
jgi:hypothetical protein